MNDFALLLLRTVTAGFMLSHGVPKMMHSEDHAKSFEGMGFVPGATYAMLGGTVETAAAALMGLGVLGAAGPMMLFSDMIVAIAAVSAREKTFNFSDHEIETIYAVIAVFFALGGFGRWSVDAAISRPLFNAPIWRILSIPGGISGAVFMLARRRTARTGSEA